MATNNRDQEAASSFTTDLFGASDSSPNSSSNALFSSIFAAPSAVAARYYPASKLNEDEQKLPHGSQSLDNGDARKLPQCDMIKNKEGESNFSSGKELSSIFEERPKPSPLSSSLYYGGKENKEGGGVDDLNGSISDGASRGNWWQGSLYY